MEFQNLPELEYYKIDDLKCKKNLDIPYNRFESLNGETVENKRVEEFNASYGKSELKEISTWIIIFEIGLMAAFISCTLCSLISFFSKWQYELLKHVVGNLNIATTDLNVYVAVTLLHSIFLIVAVIFISTMAPLVAGSGLGFLRIYLNGIDLPDLFTFKTMIIKLFAILAVVSGGFVATHHESVIYFGACVAKYITTTKYLSLNLNNYFDTERDTRDFILAGIATATAASFHCLFCGMLLSIELCGSLLNHGNVLRVLASACMGYIVMHIYDIDLGVLTIIEDSVIPNFRAMQEATNFFEIFLYFLLAAIIGIIGGLWTFGCNATLRLQKKYQSCSNTFGAICGALIVYWLTRLGQVSTYLVIPDCGEAISSLFCKSENSISRSIISWCNIASTERYYYILTEPLGSFDILYQFYYVLHTFVFSCLCQHLKLPIGRLLVLLKMGAMFGRIYAELLYKLFGWQFLNATLYALIGSAAMIGSQQFYNMSYTVLMLECYNFHLKFTIPIAASNLIGAAVSHYLFKDFYAVVIQNIPFLNYKPPDRIANFKAKHIMASPVLCFKTKEKAQYIYETLKNCCHNGFPVVDKVRNNDRSNGRFRGMITRVQLIDLFLTFKAIERDTKEVKIPIGQRYWQRQSILSESINLSTEINLFYEMNHFAFSVTADYPMVKVYSTFLALALRHMPVISNDNRVIGIISRKDFLIPKEYDFAQDAYEKEFWEI